MDRKRDASIKQRKTSMEAKCKVTILEGCLNKQVVFLARCLVTLTDLVLDGVTTQLSDLVLEWVTTRV